jgi:hypothetical protein
MNVQQQRPDGSWGPAQPLGYQPGYDIERFNHGCWVLYRTTKTASVEVASGRTTVGMLLAYWWHRLRRPG